MSPRTLPVNCNPLVRELFVHQYTAGMTNEELAERSGVARSAFNHWLARSSPTLTNFEAAIGALGGRLRIEWE